MIGDPLHTIENKVRELHDHTGKYTKPVLKRYPLLFAFLITFSIAAILHGFEIWTDQVPLFYKHPTLLMLIGIVALALTGTLYKALDKMK